MPGDWRGTLWTLLVSFCIVIIGCTETFWSPCIYIWTPRVCVISLKSSQENDLRCVKDWHQHFNPIPKHISHCFCVSGMLSSAGIQWWCIWYRWYDIWYDMAWYILLTATGFAPGGSGYRRFRITYRSQLQGISLKTNDFFRNVGNQ
jgi:hypothetical protein